MDKEKVCAIVSTYNEGKRIKRVIEELLKCNLIDEIIISDDGSNDNTYNYVCEFDSEKITYIKNPINDGKANAMDLGVRVTNSNILFFCDADLIDFNKEIIESILSPVINKEYEMFIGVRKMPLNKYRLFLWSGQRAIRRELWERVPKFYKHGFRIELGLNLFCKGYSYEVYRFRQVIKEIKRGIFYGLYRRFFMYYQIFSGIGYYYLNKRFIILD